MRITPWWAILIGYMSMAIILTGYYSPWSWFGLALAFACRVCRRPSQTAAPAVSWQGPHFLRRRQAAADSVPAQVLP